jgi:micrococcal nuclease
MEGGLLGSFALLAIVALLVLRPWEAGSGPPAPPSHAAGRVVRVIDGDTFEVELPGGVEDVRLIGIDTPETVKPDTPVQCYGERASHFTHRLLEGRRVRLRVGVEPRDVYGRLLAYVRVGGLLVNAALVRRGLARTLTIPPNDRLAPRLRRLELRAARAGRGLWSACGP